MNTKKCLQVSLLIAGACASLLLISVQYTRADLTVAPAAPTELTAVYSTIPNGPEIQLTVRDNASNETWQCLYWHVSGSAWPGSSCLPDVFVPPTWSMPASVGRMQIAAPGESGTYEYLLWACNSAGCTSSNIATVHVPNTSPPNAPSNLRLDPPPTASTVFLKWDDQSSNEDTFTVDRKFSTDANYAGTLHWAEVSSNVTSFSDTNIVPGQRYDYRVQACNAIGCSSSVSLAGVGTVSPAAAVVFCTSLEFVLLDKKTSYTVGENVNYSYKCLPTGTNAPSVVIQLLKPDGTATTYVTSENAGAVAQQMGFSTSNLANGSYILKACLNDTSCRTGSGYSIPFTVVGTAATATNSSSSATAGPSTLVTPSISPPSTVTPGPATTFTPTANTSSIPTTGPGTVVTPSTSTPSAVSPGPGTTVIPTTNPSSAATPGPGAADFTLPPFPSVPLVLGGAKCMRYLGTVKSALNRNERTIVKMKYKMKNAPENYVNFDEVTSIFSNADTMLLDARSMIKKKECSQQTLESIRDAQDEISNLLQDIFAYNREELQYFKAYAQCTSRLANRTRKMNALVRKEKNKEKQSSLQDALSEITQKTQEFANDASRADFPDVNYQCNDYVRGLDDDIHFYLRAGTL